MTLTLHNSLTGKKEVFVPQDPQHISMYVCGPTVYNYIHIGNARSAVVYDLLFRVLQKLFPQVTFARNFTDVDDKINAAAQAQQVAIGVITEKYIAAYNADMAALGNLPPTLTPRATDHIAAMIDTIGRLVQNNHAYVADGHVLFAVDSFAHYGKLAKRNLADMRAGARVEVASFKRNPMDFVLWKPSTEDLPGWPSPWGRGRPGWHIECTAMIQQHLGDCIDIHGGGDDLLFPHHENELAQGSCCGGDGNYVNYWIHNAMLNVEGEKMSKSLGNFIVLRELLQQQPPELVRLALLSTHYRSTMNWSKQLLQQSRALLDRLYTIKQEVAARSARPVDITATSFFRALLDDLNMPKALATLHEQVNQYFKASAAQKPSLAEQILVITDFLNIAQQSAEDWFQAAQDEQAISAAKIETLLSERTLAKEARDFIRADAIRAILAEAGVKIKDTRDGTQWQRESEQ